MRPFPLLLLSGLVLGVVSAQDNESLLRQEKLKLLKEPLEKAWKEYTRFAFRQARKEGDPEEPIEKAWKEYTRVADTIIPKMLDLVREDPRSPAAFDVLTWIALEPRNLSLAHGKQAVELLRHHTQNPDIAKTCAQVGDLWREYEFQPVWDLLKTVADKNPDRAARGNALLGLARLHNHKAEYLHFHEKGDPAPLRAEAERLFARIESEFGDCPNLRTGEGTLAQPAKAELYELRHLSIGKVAPEMNGEALDGKPLKLSAFRGKVVVVTFWGTWCGPCMRMIVEEKKWAERYKDRPFALVGVNTDLTREKGTAGVEKEKISWPSFWDGHGGPIADTWNVHAFPTAYLLDDLGVIRWKDNGHSERFDRVLEQVLAEAEKRSK
jgi:thiol-disulfide isomerase/thioredoxin